MKTTLDEILNFKHPAVVRRFQKDHPAKADQAETLFSDLLRFFWASKKHQVERLQEPHRADLDFVFIMDEEMREIDQIWHVFLLYTQDYMEFCDRYFGEYLHHKPDVVPNFEKGAFDFEANLVKFLDYAYDALGPDVVARWFSRSLAA